MVYRQDGLVEILADSRAEDSPAARARYAHPYYRAAQRLAAVGYNLPLLGGL